MTTVVASLADLDSDPYPVYQRLRADQPVCWLPDLKQWLVTRWADVAQVLDEPGSFTTDIPGSALIQLCDGVPLGAREGQNHDELREAVVHDYDPHRINDFVDTIVRPHAERLIAALLPAGRAELHGDYFEPVTLLSHASLLGIDSDVARLRGWGTGMVHAATNFHGDPAVAAAGRAAMADLDSVLDPLVSRLRTEPDESLISRLVHGDRPDAEDTVNTAELARAVDQIIRDGGANVITTTGSFGEFHTLLWEEHKKLIDAWDGGTSHT